MHVERTIADPVGTDHANVATATDHVPGPHR